MNLTDEQLRSLKAITQCNGPRDCAGTEKGCVTCGGYVPGLSHDELLALVEEVERLRGFLRELNVQRVAAKAEAGKGLYEALIDPSPRNDLPEVLARWEAANAE